MSPQHRLAAQTRVSMAHRKHKHVPPLFIPKADGSRNCHQVTHAQSPALGRAPLGRAPLSDILFFE